LILAEIELLDNDEVSEVGLGSRLDERIGELVAMGPDCADLSFEAGTEFTDSEVGVLNLNLLEVVQFVIRVLNLLFAYFLLQIDVENSGALANPQLKT
jgi:hypothetical protein